MQGEMGLPGFDPDEPELLVNDLREIRERGFVGIRKVGEFIHYSFYEYLMAGHVADVLTGAAEPKTIMEVCRADLSREIRHFLIGQLRAASSVEVSRSLVETYRPGFKKAEKPETPAGSVRQARKINRALAEVYPYAHPELDFESPFELLVATVLSAQTADLRMNQTTPALFARYPTPEDPVTLPGVGRKTANVVLGGAFGVAGTVVLASAA